MLILTGKELSPYKAHLNLQMEGGERWGGDWGVEERKVEHQLLLVGKILANYYIYTRLFIYLFIFKNYLFFGCTGSSLLCAGFL